ncbi:MAG: hypothetical protein WA709_12530, partial [Stellaceae bacterium]
RRQMVDLVRAGRDPADLAREFEPTAQSISHWVAQFQISSAARGTAASAAVAAVAVALPAGVAVIAVVAAVVATTTLGSAAAAARSTRVSTRSS